MNPRTTCNAALVLVLALCLPATAPAQEPICLQPIDPGPCRGSCPRWGYDSDAGECVPFTYGCCEGNENNFLTWAECVIKCEGGEPCSLPPDPGPCDGLCPSWYHDAATGECREFTWGCCEGNPNRFPTREECERVCGDCVPPGDPGLLFVTRDADDVVLSWSAGSSATAWNVYRDAGPDPSSWGPAHAAGVTDSDPAVSGVQHRDAGAVLAGPRLYYLVTSLNGCGESPLR